MMCVGRLAPAAQGDRGRLLAHQEQRCTFADVDAATIDAERIAQLGADRIKRGETGNGELAQGIDAAADDGVAQSHVEQTRSTGHGFGTGGAGTGMDIGRAADAEGGCQCRCRRTELLLTVMIVGGEVAVDAFMLEGGFAFSDAGGAGAQYDADALRTVAFDHGVNLGAYLRQRRQGDPVVAALFAQWLMSGKSASASVIAPSVNVRCIKAVSARRPLWPANSRWVMSTWVSPRAQIIPS